MYGAYGESSSNRSCSDAFAPNGEFDETWTNLVTPARRARSTTSWVPPILTSNSSRTARCGWITAAAWNTEARPTPSNRASMTVGSRTSPGTASMRGSTTSSSAASSALRTRQRMRWRAGCSAIARTKFCPSHPAAPVTTAAGAHASLLRSEPLLTGGDATVYPGTEAVRGDPLPYCLGVPDAPPDALPDAPDAREEVAIASDTAVASGVQPGRSGRRREAIALGLVALVFAIPLLGLLRAPGPPMEEGFMLVFPERVLHGDIPNRDFLHLYGPGSVWALASIFKVLGTSLWTERLAGYAQQVALVTAGDFAARPWGRWLAASGAAVTAIVIVPPIGLTALAWVGGVALGLWAMVAVTR